MALGIKERVATETYVEREPTEYTRTTVTWAYRLCWEGTVIASTEITVGRATTEAERDSIGITRLLSALATV